MAKRKRTQGQRSTKHTYIQKYAKDMISHSLQTACNVAKITYLWKYADNVWPNNLREYDNSL